MSSFTTADIAGMRATQQAHMMDRCILLRWTGSVDSFGKVRATYVPGPELACGLGWRESHEAPDADKTVERWDMTLRLPVGTSLDPRDRVQVIERFGITEADPITYELAGEPATGPSGLRVPIKRVTI